MNELVKRKKEIEEEFDEILEMDSDLINAKSNMTISTVGKLLEKFNEISLDLVDILSKKDSYDKNLTSAIEKAIKQVSDKFSAIQPPTINVTPKLNFDIQPLQNIASKISEQNGTLIALVGKFNNNQNESLVKLITALTEKQIAFLEREIKNFDYTNSFKGVENAINNRPDGFISKVTKYNSQNRIEEITTKIIK